MAYTEAQSRALLEAQGAWPRATGNILGAALKGVAYLQAQREAKVETGRSRAARSKIAELKDILRYGDPESETYQKALIELQELEGTTYTHQFPMRPRRAARREEKGKLPYRQARPVSLMAPENLGELQGAVTERRAEDWATEQARREAKRPFELSREAITAIGKEPTEVTPKGYGWDVYGEARPGLEKYKAETGRIGALRPRGGGGGGAEEEEVKDITTMKQRVNKLWGPDEVGITMPELGTVYGTYFKKVLGARTPDEIDVALEKFEAKVGELTKLGAGLSEREIRRRNRRKESLESPAMQSAAEDILDTARKAAEEMKRGLQVYGVRGEGEIKQPPEESKVETQRVLTELEKLKKAAIKLRGGTKKPLYLDILGD